MIVKVLRVFVTSLLVLSFLYSSWVAFEKFQLGETNYREVKTFVQNMSMPSFTICHGQMHEKGFISNLTSHLNMELVAYLERNETLQGKDLEPFVSNEVIAIGETLVPCLSFKDEILRKIELEGVVRFDNFKPYSLLC